MAAAIWSTDLTDVNEMPALFFIRFLRTTDSIELTARAVVYASGGRVPTSSHLREFETVSV